MATYDVIETITEDSYDGSMDDQFRISGTASRAFTIALSTGAEDDAIKVWLNANLPRYGQSHPQSTQFFVDKVRVKRRSTILYDCSVTYRTHPYIDGITGSPTELPVDVTYQSVTTSEEIDTDAAGNVLTNPNTGEPIEGITRDITDTRITLKKNMAYFNHQAIASLNLNTNNDTFLDWPPGQVRIDEITGTLAIADSSPYWEVTGVMTARTPYLTTPDKAWHHRRVLMGYYEAVAIAGTDPVEYDSIRAVDDENVYVTKPVLLAEDGTRLPKTGTPVIEFRQLYPSTNFSALGFV